jgi:hypothetical protein
MFNVPKLLVAACCFFLLSGGISISYAQETTEGQDQNPYNFVTGGISVKPIFPSKLFGNGPILMDTAGVNFTIQPQLSYCAGALVRRSFTKLLALETGLFLNRRIYDMRIVDTNKTLTTVRYRIAGFNIPLQALVFVQLSKSLFSTVSLGGSLDIYPSSILVIGGEQYRLGGLKKSLLGVSLLASFGFEYRTKKDGIIYLGASYNRPFGNIFYNEITWDIKAGGRLLQKGSNIGGSFLALDIRYYLQPSPIIKGSPKKKSKKKTQK